MGMVMRGVCFVLLVFGMVHSVHAGAGRLDPAFGDKQDGTMVLAVRDSSGNLLPHQWEAVLMQKDKIVLGGFTTNLPNLSQDFLLARLNANGLLDPTFGNSGIVKISAAERVGLSLPDDGITALAFQGEKIIALGFVKSSGASQSVLARFDANGNVDTSFGTNGFVPVAIPNTRPVALAIDPNQQILAVGHRTSPGSKQQIFAFRMEKDGKGLDQQFGVNGFILLGSSGEDLRVHSVFAQKSGSFILSGWSGELLTQKGFLAGIKADGGRTDPQRNPFNSEFGPNGDGRITFDKQKAFQSFLSQPDGKLLVSGMDSLDYNVLRCVDESCKQFDTGFGTEKDPFVRAGRSLKLPDTTSVALQPDGKVLFGGNAGFNISDSTCVAYRVNSNGTSDEKFFGVSGEVEIPGVGQNFDCFMTGLAVQSDGGLIVIGWTHVGANAQRAGFVARHIDSYAELELELLSAPSSFNLGETVVFKYRVTNKGPDQSGKVKFTDPLPAGLEYLSSDSTKELCTGGSNQVECQLKELDKDAPVEITIKAKVQSNENLGHTATVTIEDTSFDPNLKNNTIVFDTKGLASPKDDGKGPLPNESSAKSGCSLNPSSSFSWGFFWILLPWGMGIFQRLKLKR